MAGGENEGSPYKIQTFVFLDLETLGLDYKPRILEISMIAVSREDLLSMKHQAHHTNPLYKRGDPLPLPRVCCKYTMLYYPKKNIYPLIEEITGLSNYNLHHMKGFDKDSATAIKLFLDLPKPVGIIAHNGDKFDFPILKAELMGVQEENLEGVVCIDSAKFSRYFEAEDIKIITEIAKDFLSEDFVNNGDCNTSTNSHIMENGVNGNSTSNAERLEDIPSCSSDRTAFNDHHDNFQSPKKLKFDDSSKNGEAYTPKKLTIKDFFTPEKLKRDQSNKTPPPLRGKNGLPPPIEFTPSPKRPLSENGIVQNGNGLKVRKALFNEPPVHFPDLKKKPFRQPHIYYRIYGQNYLAHTAESDAEALLQICGYFGQDFVSWADNNFTPFKIVDQKWNTKKKIVI